jgi:hypothetical protein
MQLLTCLCNHCRANRRYRNARTLASRAARRITKTHLRTAMIRSAWDIDIPEWYYLPRQG